MPDTSQIVVISDLHFHDWRAYASGRRRNNSRLQQTLKVVRSSLESARQRDAPWLCAGDFFHTVAHTDNAVFNAAYDLFEMYPDVHKVAVWGDHDTRGKGSTPVSLEEAAVAPFRDLERFHLLDNETWTDPETDLQIYGAGGQPKPEFIDFGPGGDVGLFHVTVAGAETPTGYELPSTIEGYDLTKYRLAICGDVHHPQYAWSEDGELLFVPGAPEHHNFGDEGERGWWVVRLEARADGWWPAEDPDLQESDSPKFLTVQTSDEIPEDDDYNKYRVVGEEVDEEDLPANATVVGSPPTTVESRDLLEDAGAVEEILEAWLDHKEVSEERREEHLEAARDVLQDSGEMLQLRDCRLRRVEIEDFLSFRDVTYEIEDGVTLVVGESNDFDSNGAGKSALIVEAIYWALFGRTARDASADAVIYGRHKDPPLPDAADECRVRLDIEMADGTSAWIERSRRTGRPEVQASIGGEDVEGQIEGSSARDITDAFTHSLGLTPDIYRALACYNQEDLVLLTRATDSERKDLISDWSGLDVYQKASTEAGRRATDCQKARDELRSRVEAHEESLQEAQSELENRREALEEWEARNLRDLEAAQQELEEIEADDSVERARNRLEQIRERAELLADRRRAEIEQTLDQRAEEVAAEKQAGLRDMIEEVRKDMVLDLPRPEIVQARTNWQDKKTEAEKARSRAQEGLSQARARKARVGGKLEDAEQELSEAMDLEPGSECPKCQQEVGQTHVEQIRREARSERDHWRDKVEEVTEEVREAKRSVRAAEEDHEEALERVQMLTKELDSRDRLSELEESLESVGEHARELVEERIESEVEAAGRHVQGWVSRAEDVVRDWAAEHERDLERAREEVERLGDLDNPHVETVESLEARAEKLTDKIATAEAEAEEKAAERRIYEFWNEGFSRRGIQSLLLDELASAFNQMRRRVFPLLTHGVYDVQFSTQRRTKEGELREKTEFIVREHGEKVEYGSLSGGQKRRVDVGVMLTLILANAHRRQVPGVLGILVLDETFDFLDGDGAEALSDTLDQLTSTIPSIYVVTQNTEMQSLFPRTLLVEQDESGVSKIAA